MATAADLTKDDLEGLMVLLADVRDEIGEAAKTLARLTDSPPTTATLARIEERLAVLARPQAPRVQAPRVGWRGRWLVVPLLAALGGAGGGWYAGGRGQQEIRAQARLMGQVDALLVARAEALPPAFRSAVQQVYSTAGFHSPEQRTPQTGTRRQTGGRP